MELFAAQYTGHWPHGVTSVLINSILFKVKFHPKCKFSSSVTLATPHGLNSYIPIAGRCNGQLSSKAGTAYSGCFSITSGFTDDWYLAGAPDAGLLSNEWTSSNLYSKESQQEGDVLILNFSLSENIFNSQSFIFFNSDFLQCPLSGVSKVSGGTSLFLSRLIFLDLLVSVITAFYARAP